MAKKKARKKRIPKVDPAKSRLAKSPDKAMRIAMQRQVENPDADPRTCIGHSWVYTDKTCREKKLDPETGLPMRKPCEKPSMRGQVVCYKHGGNAPQAKAAAERRLAAYVDRFADRLIEISEQGLSYPAALGATIQGLKINKIIKEKDASGPSETKVVIGIQFGNLATAQTKVKGQLYAGGAVEAEVIDITPESADSPE